MQPIGHKNGPTTLRTRHGEIEMKRNSFRYKGRPPPPLCPAPTHTFTRLLGGLANFSQMHIKIHLARPTDFVFILFFLVEAKNKWQAVKINDKRRGQQ